MRNDTVGSDEWRVASVPGLRQAIVNRASQPAIRSLASLRLVRLSGFSKITICDRCESAADTMESVMSQIKGGDSRKVG